MDWLFHFEHKLLGIPELALVLYLRVAPNVSQKLMTGRYKGDEEKKNIHERDVVYLNHCRGVEDYCSGRLGWKTIECADGGGMKSIGDIQEEVIRSIRTVPL